MSYRGTQRYESETGLPPLVSEAVAAARRIGFDLCVHPATGRLLQVLAAGIPSGGVIAETGTGTGTGLAWLASGARSDVSLLSVEIDVERSEAATEIFANTPNVTVIAGDAGELFSRGPFDLLVLDGGWGSGKNDGPVVDVSEVLTEGGLITVDDFTPMKRWPPTFEGTPDTARTHWLTQFLMLIVVAVAPRSASIFLGFEVPRIWRPELLRSLRQWPPLLPPNKPVLIPGRPSRV